MISKRKVIPEHDLYDCANRNRGCRVKGEAWTFHYEPGSPDHNLCSDCFLKSINSNKQKKDKT